MVIKIEIYELLKAFSMQKKCFKPIYEKYYDETSPCKESFAKFVSRTTKSSFQMYWIIANSTKVGQIWIQQNLQDCLCFQNIKIKAMQQKQLLI